MLYDSLHGKLLTLQDEVGVYPAHGAGSLCGRNISQETSSTIGEQRRTNYALRPMSKADFVRLATADLPEVPQYFGMDVALNRAGAAPLSGRPLPPALAPAEVLARTRAGALVLDVRSAAAFGAGHVPGSWNIGLSGQFASWAGTLVDPQREILLAADDEAHAAEATLRLSRVGLEKVTGHLAGGIAAWQAKGYDVATLPQWPVDELRAQLDEAASLQLIDVRRPGEYAAGHVPHARSIPLDRLLRESGTLDRSRPIAVVCASGYRSNIACSLLRQHGFTGPLYNIVGGTTGWVAAGFPIERPA